MQRAVIAVLVAAAVGVSVWRLPGMVRDAQSQVDAVQGLTRQERALLPGRSFDLETDTYLAAANIIPPGATYYLATGNGVVVSSPNVLSKAPVFAGYWLLPRRLTIDPHLADWVFSYGGDLKALGLQYSRIVVIKPGWEVAEVRR
jgi:hypothetical protein